MCIPSRAVKVHVTQSKHGPEHAVCLIGHTWLAGSSCPAVLAIDMHHTFLARKHPATLSSTIAGALFFPVTEGVNNVTVPNTQLKITSRVPTKKDFTPRLIALFN